MIEKTYQFKLKAAGFSAEAKASIEHYTNDKAEQEIDIEEALLDWVKEIFEIEITQIL